MFINIVDKEFNKLLFWEFTVFHHPFVNFFVSTNFFCNLLTIFNVLRQQNIDVDSVEK